MQTPANIQLKVLRPQVLEAMARSGLPHYATPSSAGVDLAAALEAPVTLAPGATHLMPTGIAVHIADPGLAGVIMSRSGLGTKQGLVVKQGVGLIDADYQGELLVALHNISDEPRTVNPGDRIAQLVLMPVVRANWLQVEDFSQETLRGEGGFGSTGLEQKV